MFGLTDAAGLGELTELLLHGNDNSGQVFCVSVSVGDCGGMREVLGTTG